jgi:hypothetical protein
MGFSFYPWSFYHDQYANSRKVALKEAKENGETLPIGTPRNLALTAISRRRDEKDDFLTKHDIRGKAARYRSGAKKQHKHAVEDGPTPRRSACSQATARLRPRPRAKGPQWWVAKSRRTPEPPHVFPERISIVSWIADIRERIGSVNTSAFVGTNPMGELITSALPVIQPVELPVVTATHALGGQSSFGARALHSPLNGSSQPA